MSGLGIFDPEALGKEEEHEVDRLRWALELEEGFAFHVIVADSRDVFEAAQLRLPRSLWTLRPRPPRQLSIDQAAAHVLAELDRVIDDSEGNPILLDAMLADREPAWAMVFRRLNELRNGLERRHPAPLIVAVSPAGESSLGREAPDLWSRRGSGMRLHDHVRQHLAETVAGRLPPPNEPSVFESLCLDLWSEIWNDPGAQKKGRSGQAQDAVDVFGVYQGRQMGVQCKQRDGLLRTRLTVRELEKEIEMALDFKPRLDTFILATTGPADARVQERAREITEENRARALFKVEVWSWDAIWREIYLRQKLLDRLLPIYWPRSSALEEGGRIAPSKLTHVVSTLFGRDDELARLDAAWADPGIHVVILVAWGGVGKTSLVATWAAQLVGHDLDGASYFDWSFYSQGTREGGSHSSDAFITAALEFFGDAEMARRAASPWDKGARLSQLVAERQTLLVLDGLEPLQHPPGPLVGELKDPAVTALLTGLAARNPGLCVVTTREPVVDLASFRDTTAPEWRLAHLSSPAGVLLLRTLGVYGADHELVQLVQDVHGHALTLNLLGQYLARAHGGDVRRRDTVKLKRADLRTQGGHAFGTIAAYESWLAAGGEAGVRQLAILRLLGLFDRPADTDALAALRRAPIIAGLTEPLADLTEVDWNLAVASLVDSGLIPRPTPGVSSLDTHPLIREYFARQLREHSPAAWHEAHGRLFEHLQESTEYQPDTLEGLQPLYQAVVHGCQAGREQEACDKVYCERILRGMGTGGFYSTKKLGAFGADLGAVACFFEPPWSRVSPSFTEADQAWLLNEAAFSLRALGRLTEAVEPMLAGLRGAVRLEDWNNAARYASDLSELQLTLGDLPGAVAAAEQSVDFADRRGDAFERMAERTALADALHQAGRRDAALARFREAEEMQAERDPTYPRLYSLWGFRYCDLLLAGPERVAWVAGSVAVTATDGVKSLQDAGPPSGLAETCRDVERRAGQTLQWAESVGVDILSATLDHLTLGRAGLYGAILEWFGTSDDPAEFAIENAASEIEQAVDGLRRAGRSDHLPKGLLIRAWVRALTGDADGARLDLDEVWEIAERGPMPLFQADVHLHRARLFHDRVALAEARRLVEKHGYARRMEELADAEAAAEDW